jgi:hypothetical protein
VSVSQIVTRGAGGSASLPSEQPALRE